LLQNGEIVAQGPTEDVVADYNNIQIKNKYNLLQIKDNKHIESASSFNINATKEDKYIRFLKDNKHFLKRAAYKRTRNGKAEFLNCILLDENEKEIRFVEYGQTVILRIGLVFYEYIKTCNVGFHIQNKGISILYATSITENRFINNANAGDNYIMDFKFKLEIQQGVYNILIACHVPDKGEYLYDNAFHADFVHTAYQFEMAQAKPRPIHGYVHVETVVDIQKVLSDC